MAEYRKPKLEHRHVKVYSQSDFDSMVSEQISASRDRHEPSDTHFLGESIWLQDLVYDRFPENCPLRYLQLTSFQAEGREVYPSLQSLSFTMDLLRLINERMEAKIVDEQGNKIQPNAPAFFRKVKHIVILSGETRYLPYLLDHALIPLTIWEIFSGENPEKPFSSMSEWDVPEHKEIVKDLLIEEGIHVWAGLFESAKTMFSYELSAKIIEEGKVGGTFQVLQSYPILHLCMDMSPSLQKKYAGYFGLDDEPQFLGLNPQCDVFMAVDSPELAKEAAGKILILDTMLDWARMEDAFRSGEWIIFFQKLRSLIKQGCKAIILICHPTKTGARNTTIDATEFLKDSVTFGGKIDVGFAFRKVEESSKIFVKRIKGRGFDAPLQFTIATHDEQGNSYIGQGEFPVIDEPEDCKELETHLPQKKKPGRKRTMPADIELDLYKKALTLAKSGMSYAEIAFKITSLAWPVNVSWVKHTMAAEAKRRKNAPAEQVKMNLGEDQ